MHFFESNVNRIFSLKSSLGGEFDFDTLVKDSGALKAFCELTHVSMEEILTRDLDSEFLEARMQNKLNLDQKYQLKNEGSGKVKTLFTLVNHLDKLGLENSSNILINRFGLTRDFLKNNLNKPVNPDLIMDFFNSLGGLDLSEKRIEIIGAEGKNYLPTTLVTKIKALKNVRDLLGFLYEEVFSTQYDDLFEYKLHKLDGNEAVALTIPKVEAHQIYGKLVGDKTMCAYKRGIVEGALKIAGVDAEIFETECIYDGDKACKTHIKLPSVHLHQ